MFEGHGDLKNLDLHSDSASHKRDLYGLCKSHFIQEAQARQEVQVSKVRTQDNRSNVLSKPIYSVHQFQKERDVLMNARHQVRPRG